MFKLAFLCNIDSEKLLRQHIALPKGTLVSLIQRLLYLAEYLLLATEVISDFFKLSHKSSSSMEMLLLCPVNQKRLKTETERETAHNLSWFLLH